MMTSVTWVYFFLLNILNFVTHSATDNVISENVQFPDTISEKEIFKTEILKAIQSLKLDMEERSKFSAQHFQKLGQQLQEWKIEQDNTENTLILLLNEMESLKTKVEEMDSKVFLCAKRQSNQEHKPNDVLSSFILLISHDVKSVLKDLGRLQNEVVDIRSENKIVENKLVDKIGNMEAAINITATQISIHTSVDSAAKNTLKEISEDLRQLKKYVVDAVVDTSNVTRVYVSTEIQSALNVTVERISSLKNFFSSEERSTMETSKRPNDVERKIFSSCAELLKAGHRISGIYNLSVYCDMETDGGGWTVFQRRQLGYPQVDFNKNWTNYKEGFGQLDGEFWLGLEKIHLLTSVQEVGLRVDLEAFSKEKKYAKYQSFLVGSEEYQYSLLLSGYSGDAGDSLGSHSGKAFSTKDNNKFTVSCSQDWTGGWWLKECYYSSLNGVYMRSQSSYNAINWRDFKGTESLKKTEMKMKQLSCIC